MVWATAVLAAASSTARVQEANAIAARDRLRERYAAGEIDDEEYERRLATLTHWS